MQYGCIGEKLGHSFSKEIHAAFADYTYELCEMPCDALKDFFQKKEFLGINVTIPYKEAVIPFLDEIDVAAKSIGAVNTVINRGGRLYGYNTDFDGMNELIARVGVPLGGKKVAVLGSGGTSRTACAVAASLGAATVLRVGRTEKEGTISYERLLSEHRDLQYIINTTPCGMYPYAEGREGMRAAAVDVGDFPMLLGVADAVYNPLRSQLVLDAQKRNIPALGGLSMLVAQAVRAAELFTDRTLPRDTTDRVLSGMLRQKENVVLIGMPSSGKSSVGARLAELLERPFVDLDRCIEERTGRSIPEIFATVGESGFRDVESQVVAEQSQSNRAVIATGGGAILRDRNVDNLRRNGRLYFLDRPLEALLPTEDRPLSSTREAIEARYRERYQRYLSVADRHIPVTGDVAAVAEMIASDFLSGKREEKHEKY